MKMNESTHFSSPRMTFTYKKCVICLFARHVVRKNIVFVCCLPKPKCSRVIVYRMPCVQAATKRSVDLRVYLLPTQRVYAINTYPLGRGQLYTGTQKKPLSTIALPSLLNTRIEVFRNFSIHQTKSNLGRAPDHETMGVGCKL